MRRFCSALLLALLALSALPGTARAASATPECGPEPYLPRPVHQVLMEAQELEARGRKDRALALLSDYAAGPGHRGHPRLAMTLGLLHYAAGDMKAAGRSFARAVEAWPCFAEAWRNLGVVRWEEKKPAQAAEALVRAFSLGKEPEWGLLYEAGAMYLAADQPQKALPLLQRLAGRPSPRVEWLRALVETHRRLGQAAQALTVLERLLEMEPGNPRLWRLWAGLHLEASRWRPATAGLEVAGRLGGAAPPRELASVQRAAGIPRQAAQTLARALGPDPDPADLDRLAETWLQAKDLEEALAVSLRAARQGPTPARWQRVGRIRLTLKRYPQAREAFVEAAALSKGADAARPRLLAGYCALQAGALDQARQDLERAVKEAKPGSRTQGEARDSLRELIRFQKARAEGLPAGG